MTRQRYDPYRSVEGVVGGAERAALGGLAGTRAIRRLWAALLLWSAASVLAVGWCTWPWV